MAAYPIPNPQYGIYNQNNFTKNPTGQDGLTLDTAKLYFLQFPNAQTTQTEYLHDIGVSGSATFEGPVTFNDEVTYNQDIEYTQNVTVDGDVTIIGNTLLETGTFQDILTCEKGIDISVAPYGITFPDNTTQTTAFIEANYAQLNTDNIFLEPYKNTFQQNNSTTSTTAPLQITNSTNNDNATFYIDPAPSVDLTLYSNQTNGGLTVRNPTASYTLNPVTITPGIVGARSLNPIDMNANTLYGLNNVYSSGSNISLKDSAGDAMMQLTTSGNTCYKNLNMNLNSITNASTITSPTFNIGTIGQIANSPTLNPQIMTISNTALNSTSPQIYFQMNNNVDGVVSPMQITWNATNIWGSVGGIYSQVFSATGSGINIGAVPLRVNNIQANGSPSIGVNANINMNSYDITSLGPNSTGTTATTGDNSTKLATTAFVQANTPSTANFAQLTTSTPQTFTGPNNFTGGLQVSGVNVANVNQLPISKSLSITTIIVTNASLISGSSQQSIYSPASLTGQFVSNQFVIQINTNVAYNNLLTYIGFNDFPFPNWPPSPLNGSISGMTVGSGQVNLFNYFWGTNSGQAYLALQMAYNVGTGSQVAFNLASLGLINL